jgi:hypothetical protein
MNDALTILERIDVSAFVNAASIESSVRNRVVRLAWSEALEDELLAVCDDSADLGCGVTEYWADDWRIALQRSQNNRLRADG